MAFYTLPLSGIAYGVTGTVKAVGVLVVPNTAGMRARIVSIDLGVSNTPADAEIKVELRRILTAATNKGVGTAATPVKKDTGSVASNMTALTALTTQPTYDASNPVWSAAMNDRGGVIKEWSDPGDMPKMLQDEALALVVWTSATVSSPTVHGTISFEEY